MVARFILIVFFLNSNFQIQSTLASDPSEESMYRVELEEMSTAEQCAHKKWEEYKGIAFSNMRNFCNLLDEIHSGGYKMYGCLYMPLLKYRATVAYDCALYLIQHYSQVNTNEKQRTVSDFLAVVYTFYKDNVKPEEDNLQTDVQRLVNKIPRDPIYGKQSIQSDDPELGIALAVAEVVPYIKDLGNMALYQFLWTYMYKHKVVKAHVPKSIRYE